MEETKIFVYKLADPPVAPPDRVSLKVRAPLTITEYNFNYHAFIDAVLLQ